MRPSVVPPHLLVLLVSVAIIRFHRIDAARAMLSHDGDPQRRYQPRKPPLQLNEGLRHAAPLSVSPTATRAYASRDPDTGGWTVTRVTSSDVERDWLPVAAAHGYYDEAPLNSTGWALLDITAARATDAAGALSSMYGLGFLEAHFSCPRMHQFGRNFMDSMFGAGKAPDAELVEWVEEMMEWTRQRARMGHEPEDKSMGFEGGEAYYWRTVGGVLAQLDGMVEGYARFCAHLPPLTAADLLLINLNGDLFDIMPALKLEASSRLAGLHRIRFADEEKDAEEGSKDGDEDGEDEGEGGEGVDRPAHCSAAVKLLPGEKAGTFDDLFVGHATWDTFTNAWPRIFKHVSLSVLTADGEWTPHTASFSSSPGFLASIDDFYSIEGRGHLFVQETSISTINADRYSALKPQSVPCFIRAVAANRLAADGAEWAAIFSREHSGTYADQWMVVDRSRFVPGADLRGAEGLLRVLEEGPGLIVAHDMTPHLVREGYWSSFNVAFFPEMRDYMGYTNATKVKGPEYSYTDATRARLFRELLPEVDGLLGMQWLMRWNDYSIDPISNGNPVRAIAARGDLKPPVNGKSHAFGATDSKVSSWRLAEVGQVAAHAIAGPTREQQPMFCWSDADYSESHFGHPECFNMTHLAVPKSVHLPLAAGLNKFSLLNIHQAAAFEEAKAAY
mmetsp:Transcript_2298/g.4026  ORF Transcript_2298/g.4026 Transcript_2298/m.4026 type:complete len:674 (-) Transcript_2298:143-2164(-)